MSAVETGELEKEGDFSRDIELVDMGYDLLTPTHSLIAHLEMLLEYANDACQEDLIPDINKMLRAGEQLSVLLTQLFSKKNCPQTEFEFETLTSTINHNLRNRINVIIGYDEMLLEDIEKETQPEVSIVLEKILTSARRLLTLIDDLSYLYKKVYQKEALTDEVVDIPAQLENWFTQSNNKPSLDLATQGASLLVVDDEESNRDLLSRRLKKQGFNVKVAKNGRQALQKIRSQHFDLILLDIRMPEMDGYQVLEALKKDQELSRIPVIMISALDEIDGVVHCIEMGAEDYLQKPPKQVILNAKISATLERKRLRDRERALLLNILPQPIVDRLKKGEQTIADDFSEVTVLFSDLVGFTELAAKISAEKLVEKLNQIFFAFDLLTEKYGLEKIKTIGDAYMLVGGLPTERPDHAEAVANIAIEMLQEIERLNKQNNNDFRIRIGIHTGPVIAGIIGKHKFNYDLWGETVNIASRMESHGIPDCIQISETTYQHIKNKFIFSRRGPIYIKGKGEMVTYLLKGIK